MKLIAHTNRNIILISLISFPILAFLIFRGISAGISNEMDEKLHVDLLRIEQELTKNPELSPISPIFDIRKIKEIKNDQKTEEKFSNVVLFDPIEKENEPFRELAGTRSIHGSTYLIKVRHSTIESKDLIYTIGTSLFLSLILFFSFLIFLNYRFSIQLWKPFYENMKRLKNFTFAQEEEIQLLDSKVSEFQSLKKSIVLLTSKLQSDYSSLKEFTENASHEIQTPLSIISLNLEELMQSQVSEEDYKKIYTCYQTTRRLSNLNEKLILLTKLDNKQFINRQTIDFNKLIETKLNEFEVLFQEKGLEYELLTEGVFQHSIDPVLANMLIDNLFSNVVKYASKESLITILISDSMFSVRNATQSIITNENLFVRFKKGQESTLSTGLGLSIVRGITENYGLLSQATIENGVFEVCISKSVLML